MATLRGNRLEATGWWKTFWRNCQIKIAPSLPAAVSRQMRDTKNLEIAHGTNGRKVSLSVYFILVHIHCYSLQRQIVATLRGNRLVEVWQTFWRNCQIKIAPSLPAALSRQMRDTKNLEIAVQSTLVEATEHRSTVPKKSVDEYRHEQVEVLTKHDLLHSTQSSSST